MTNHTTDTQRGADGAGRYSKALDRWRRDIAYNLRVLEQEHAARRLQGKPIERHHAAIRVECDVLRDALARLEAAERVGEAARRAGPFPVIADNDQGELYCCHCYGLPDLHDEDCAGVQLANLLATTHPAEASSLASEEDAHE